MENLIHHWLLCIFQSMIVSNAINIYNLTLFHVFCEKLNGMSCFLVKNIIIIQCNPAITNLCCGLVSALMFLFQLFFMEKFNLLSKMKTLGMSSTGHLRLWMPPRVTRKSVTISVTHLYLRTGWNNEMSHFLVLKALPKFTNKTDFFLI